MAIPTIEEAQAGYTAGTAAKADIWERRAAAAASDWETKAKAPEAEEAYATGVANAVQYRLRARGLEPVTSADFASAVRGKGATYRAETGRAAPKWGKKFRPYLDIIKTTVPGLAARVPGDVSGNIDRRVKPIAEALASAKRGGAGAGAGGAGYTPPRY